MGPKRKDMNEAPEELVSQLALSEFPGIDLSELDRSEVQSDLNSDAEESKELQDASKKLLRLPSRYKKGCEE